jgi:plasmid maintenance system antidote protein VapI
MFNPPHPGEVLRDGVFDGTRITVTEAALSRILNGRAGISPDMAIGLVNGWIIRLSRGFGCKWISTFGKRNGDFAQVFNR